MQTCRGSRFPSRPRSLLGQSAAASAAAYAAAFAAIVRLERLTNLALATGSLCLGVCLGVCLSVCLSVSVFACVNENASIKLFQSLHSINQADSVVDWSFVCFCLCALLLLKLCCCLLFFCLCARLLLLWDVRNSGYDRQRCCFHSVIAKKGKWKEERNENEQTHTPPHSLHLTLSLHTHTHTHTHTPQQPTQCISLTCHLRYCGRSQKPFQQKIL